MLQVDLALEYIKLSNRPGKGYKPEGWQNYQQIQSKSLFNLWSIIVQNLITSLGAFGKYDEGW